MASSADHLGNDTILEMLEGRADPTTVQRVEAHAANCTACRELLAWLVRQGDHGGASMSDGPTLVRGAGDIPIRVGRYVLVRALGQGGMGMVFAAHDPELDRSVAVKLLRGDMRDEESRHSLERRLRREARAMAKLSHPNVVTVYDVGVHDDIVFVAMELVDGVTLATWLETPRDLVAVLDAFRAAGHGLAAAHASAIVHRDFKPANVLVGSDGRVRVTDFGIAKLRRSTTTLSGGGTVALTAPNAAVGTPYYMAPEQFVGDPVGARADQFSFCVALHAALHGVLPFAGTTLDEIAQAVLAQQFVPLPRSDRVPARIHAAIVRGLAASPDARFPTMQALLAELQLDPLRPRRRLAIGAAILGTAGLVLAAVLIAREWPRSRTESPPRSAAQQLASPDASSVARELVPTDAPDAPSVATPMPDAAPAPTIVVPMPDAGTRSPPQRPVPVPPPPMKPTIDRGD